MELRNELVRLANGKTYPVSKNLAISLEPWQGLTFWEGAQVLLEEDDPMVRSGGLWGVAACLSSTETFTVSDGRELSNYELYLEALILDSNFGDVYNDLATVIVMGLRRRVTLPNGRELDEKELLLEAIRCNAGDYVAYFNLGIALGSDSITLSDGRTVTERECYLESLHLSEYQYSCPYECLAQILPSDEKITLLNGKTVTSLDMYLEALALDPTNADAYNSLGCALHRWKTVKLHDGRSFSRQIDLFFEAVRFKPHSPQLLFNFSYTMAAGVRAEMPDGRHLFKYEVLIEALIHCESPDLHKRIFAGLERLMNFPPAALTPLYWTRRTHSSVFRPQTNVLFATLLLGLERLEATQILPIAHKSVLEDTLECWTWTDATELAMTATIDTDSDSGSSVLGDSESD